MYNQIALSYRLDAISQSPKNSRFPGPNPLPLALVMDLHASKALRTGPYTINHSCINRYMFFSKTPPPQSLWSPGPETVEFLRSELDFLENFEIFKISALTQCSLKFVPR
jgi:hypothetical protein